MDINKLVRNADIVKEALTEVDGKLVTKKEVKIHIPSRFVDRGLAFVGLENYIVGIYAIILEDTYYGVSTVNAMINIDPTSTTRIKINGDQYFEFMFKPGSTVFKTLSLVKTDTVVYNIYDEIFSNGRIPWYMGYDDLGRIFDTASYHGGANVGSDKEVTELIASLVARDPADRTKYYRTKINTLEDMRANHPVYIGLCNVTYAATNTMNRLGGSYMGQGIVASLVNITERTERVEQILLA